MADTVTLTDHDEIRTWAASRAGFPAIVDVSPEPGTQAMLRLVFDQHAYEDEDRQIGRASCRERVLMPV